MTNEELEKLNFPLAVEKTLISVHAMLRTVLQNQMIIIEALNVMDNTKVNETINGLFAENVEFIETVLKNAAQESVKTIFPSRN